MKFKLFRISISGKKNQEKAKEVSGQPKKMYPLTPALLEQSKQVWKSDLASLSNAKLVEKFNAQVGNRGWGTARSMYLDCLRKEIRKRNFDSRILFDLDSSGNITAFKLGKKVMLKRGRLVLSTPKQKRFSWSWLKEIFGNKIRGNKTK
ncbi:MAG: hypothetical protein JST58_05025 [Bacteroidetes bacterium]|nr:hypothetical protein [Bacteroidota bacterium]